MPIAVSIPTPKIAVFVITLNDQNERMQKLKALLDAAGVQFHTVQAFDGRKLDLQNFGQYDKKTALKYMGRPLIGGEIGCYISHQRAAEAFIASQSDYAIILEDDAAPTDDFMLLAYDAALKLDKLRPDWHVVNIGNHYRKFTSRLCNLHDRHSTLFASHYFPITTHALIWSRQGANAFLQLDHKIFAPVDTYLRHWVTKTGAGYSIDPPLAHPSGDDSQIDEHSGQRQNHTKRSFLYGLIKLKRELGEKLRAFTNNMSRRK